MSTAAWAAVKLCPKDTCYFINFMNSFGIPFYSQYPFRCGRDFVPVVDAVAYYPDNVFAGLEDEAFFFLFGTEFQVSEEVTQFFLAAFHAERTEPIAC